MNKQQRKKYDHARYQRLHTEQIKALGGVCVECGNEVIGQLEVHHKEPYLSRSRTRAKSYFTTDRNLVEVRCGPRACKNHHADTPNYRRRKKC